MSNRALFAAFQKVKSEVEEVVTDRRQRDEKARREVEEARIRQKREARLREQAEALKAEEARAARVRAQKEAEEKVQAQAKSKKAPARRAEVKAAPRPQTEVRATSKAKARKPQSPSKKPASPMGALGATLKKAQVARQERMTWLEKRNPIGKVTLMPGLPVSEQGDELVKLIRDNRVVIICGETGSGKTTQLPKIALMAGRGETGRIAHTQPRRIAATSIAKRIAEELKTEPGEVVGYKVRFTDKTSPGATIKLMTDGILLAETQHDPLLKQYDTIIIDEAHERSLNIDFLLGYLKQLLAKRKDLKVIITSATIDANRFAEHFAHQGRAAPIAQVSGRTYPVEIRYRPMADADETDDKTLTDAIDAACHELEMAGRGDILVFLPGEREIRETADALRKTHSPVTTEILPLFARLSAADQERVFKPGAKRRIVLATNVAETSITVPGIRFVVDTGLARVNRYSYRNKVEQLQIEPVSQAAANQRAGRCGRVADGICIRLYDENDFNRRDEFTDPEILRSNLAAVILRAASLKLGDVRSFPFVTAPTPRAISDGYALLNELDAMDDDGRLTKIGRELATLPVDPRLGRMLLAGHHRDALDEVLIIASGLSIQDPRERPLDQQQAADEAHKKLADEHSDFMSYVKLWRWVDQAFANKESNRKLEAELHRRFLSVRRLREWRDVYRQLKRMTEDLGWRVNTTPATSEAVHRSLLAGLLGNIGSKAVNADYKAPPYLGARGIKFWLWPGSIRAKKGGRFVMAAELIDTTRLYARCVAEVDAEWIEAEAGSLLKKHRNDPRWEKRRGEVTASEKGTLYGITLYTDRRVSLAKHDPVLARELFIRGALVEGELENPPAFLRHNARLMRDIEEMEHKTRRPDVLVDDELIFQFYNERLPQDVATAAGLKAWIKAHPSVNRAQGEGTLFMEKADLMRREATDAANTYFPKTLTMAGVEMALTYHFEPGSPRDGVTATVPLFALNQLDPLRAQWLVPGMVKEKAALLLKSLPQKIRRHCVPLPNYAEGFYARVEAHFPPQEGFLEVLARDVRENRPVDCRVSDFKPEGLPAHLILNFKVVDEDGRQLAMGRNLAQLKAELGAEAQEAFKSVAEEDALTGDFDDEITGWTFGELPELMEINRNGQTLIGHPALVDKGEHCAIEVFDDPEEAKAEHRSGLLRLYRIALKEQVRFIERSLKDLGRLQMQAQMVPGLDKSFASGTSLTNEVVDCTLSASALVEPWPTSAQTFSARREDVKERLSLLAGEVARLLVEIVTEAAPIVGKLKRLSDEKSLVDDVLGELHALFPKGFLKTVPLDQLRHYPRYLKALNYRLDRYRDEPERDASRQAEVNRLETLWRRQMQARKGKEDEALTRFFWLLRELRVSLFAQQLRTPMPVSVKRLERVWQAMSRL